MAILAGARSAEAQQFPGVSVHWTAPAACPGSDDLQARVRRLLPADPVAVRARQPLIADALVEVLNGRYRLTLRVRRDGALVGGTRVFDSDSCESLAGAAAVTLALLARGEARADGAAPSPSGSVTSAAPAVEVPAPSKTPPPAPAASPPLATPGATAGATRRDEQPASRPEARWSPAFEAPLLAVDQGLLPSSAYGIGVGLGLRVSRLRVMLTGLLWLPQDSGAVGTYGGTYERRSGELSGCYAWPLEPFDIGPCVTVALEDVTAHGSGPDVVAEPAHATWLTIGLAARADWSLRRWTALFLRPRLTFTTSRPTFAIDGVGPIYQVPLVSAGVDIGCEWIL
jgi:hypothetical protein